MKALFFNGSLNIIETETPVPSKDEVLIKILYSSICNTDIELTKGYMNFTGVPGHEFVGEVVSKKSVLYCKKVVGEINCNCGLCEMCKKNLPTHCFNRSVLGIFNHQGTFAEYIVLKENNLHVIPENVELTDAVFTEPLAAALEIFEQVHIKPQDKIFIFGAGKLGILIAQIFHLYGCNYMIFNRGEERAAFAKSLNLNCKTLMELSENEKADICVDCSGSPQGFEISLKHLKPRGNLILKTTVAQPPVIDMNQIVINEFQIKGSRCGPFKPALLLIARKLINIKPLISKIFDFENIIDAFEFSKQKNILKILIKH